MRELKKTKTVVEIIRLARLIIQILSNQNTSLELLEKLNARGNWKASYYEKRGWLFSKFDETYNCIVKITVMPAMNGVSFFIKIDGTRSEYSRDRVSSHQLQITKIEGNETLSDLRANSKISTRAIQEYFKQILELLGT